MNSARHTDHRNRKQHCRLSAPGWTQFNRRALEALIFQGANRQLPVVFDFDNTLVCGDIGEATLAVLARSKVLTPAAVSSELCPAFRGANGRMVRMEKCADVTEYYEALLRPAFTREDRQPLATGYTWATQIMQGLKLSEVVKATRIASEWSDPATPGLIEVTAGRSCYIVPLFYPEMIELLRELLRANFDVWIVSASNAWSVRYLVANVLNPQLRSKKTPGVRADHVVGITTLLRDSRGRLHKDAVLVEQDSRYANLESSVLRRYRLTSQLQHPVPVYSGKIAAIYDRIGRNPYLVAGDSPGDLPMMSIGKYRLWIARANKTDYQVCARDSYARLGGAWIVQPTGAIRGQGFISDAPPSGRNCKPNPGRFVDGRGFLA